MIKNILFIIVIFLVLVPPISAISIFSSPYDKIFIRKVWTNTQINVDSKIDIIVEFIVKNNTNSNIFLYYLPWERTDSDPAKDFNITLCRGTNSGGGYNDLFINCEQTIFPTIRKDSKSDWFLKDGIWLNKTTTELAINFTPEFIYQDIIYILKISYFQPRLVFKQGQYYVAWINFQNMDQIPEVKNFITLPSKNSIPRFFHNTKIDRIHYKEGNKWETKWGFIYDGTNDIIIWYSDLWEDTLRNIGYIIIGALFGALFSYLFSLRLNKINHNKRSNNDGENVRMLDQTNKELIKLEYENHKTYVFASFAALLVIGFSTLANLDKLMVNPLALLFVLIGFIAVLVLFFVTHNSMKKNFDKLRLLVAGGTNTANKPTTGDAMFSILNEMCNLSNDELHTQQSLMDKLNKGKKIDAPYYGIGDEEIKLLIKQGYLSYWTPNPSERQLPDYEKALMATPKAFELIEARKNRIVAQASIRIAIVIGVFVIILSCVTLMLQLFSNNVITVIFWAAILSGIAVYYINSSIKKSMSELL